PSSLRHYTIQETVERLPRRSRYNQEHGVPTSRPPARRPPQSGDALCDCREASHAPRTPANRPRQPGTFESEDDSLKTLLGRVEGDPDPSVARDPGTHRRR